MVCAAVVGVLRPNSSVGSSHERNMFCARWFDSALIDIDPRVGRRSVVRSGQPRRVGGRRHSGDRVGEPSTCSAPPAALRASSPTPLWPGALPCADQRTHFDR